MVDTMRTQSLIPPSIILLAIDSANSIIISLSDDATCHITYTPFGHTPKQGRHHLWFHGAPRESSTGHYLLGNGYRAANPPQMRFNSPDSWSPFGNGGLNAYAFSGNNPINYSDPSGHAPIHNSLTKANQEIMNTMFQKAPEANTFIDNVAQKLGQAHGATWLPAPQKTMERALEKTIEKYNGDPTRLKDIVRNSLISKKSKIPLLLQDIESMGGRYKSINAQEDPLGYSGINAVIPTPNGLWGEIQITKKRMAYARFSTPVAQSVMSQSSFERINSLAGNMGLQGGLGHQFYRTHRNKANSIREREDAAARSRAYYGALIPQ